MSKLLMRRSFKLSFAEIHPELAAKAVNWDPAIMTFNTNTLRDWRCSLGHEYRRTIPLEISKIGLCPECSKPLPARSLAEFAPELASEAIGWDPMKRSIQSKSIVPWLCLSCGHKYQERIDYRVKYHLSCPDCEVKLPDLSVSTYRPDLVPYAHQWDPTSTLASEPITVMWKCERNHHFSRELSKSLTQVFACWKCRRFDPRDISISRLSSELKADKKEFVEFANQHGDKKMTSHSRLTGKQADQLLDIWLERKRSEANDKSLNQDYGYPLPEIPLWQREDKAAHDKRH
jgi:hypothetical protein